MDKDHISQAQKEFGRQVAALRNEIDITQEELAFRVGVDATYISLIERGEANPTLKVMIKLAFTQTFPPKAFFSTIEVPEDYKKQYGKNQK
ncbi:helix-turn-helix domain-containing protein [Halobacillus andaensis]|uniref:helix-turn-helix domain-containing protein n=1 Tax=Halobacillus andaensis TaxID=1176239 RepID=UPI003D72E794